MDRAMKKAEEQSGNERKRQGRKCPSQGVYSCTNIMTEKQVGERVFQLYTKEVRTGIKQFRKQELMQRPWRDVSYWLASERALLSLLSYRIQDYQPRDGPTHKGPPALITN